MLISTDYQEKGPLQKFKSSFNEIFGKLHDNPRLEANYVGEKSVGKDHDKSRQVDQ